MSDRANESSDVAKQQLVGYAWVVERTRKLKRDAASKFTDDEKTMRLSGNNEHATVATAEMLSANAAIDAEIDTWESTGTGTSRPRGERPLKEGAFSDV